MTKPKDPDELQSPGRRPWTPPPDPQVYEDAQSFATYKDLAAYWGCNQSTLMKYKAEHPELQDIIDRARSERNQKMRKTMIDTALEKKDAYMLERILTKTDRENFGHQFDPSKMIGTGQVTLNFQVNNFNPDKALPTGVGEIIDANTKEIKEDV